MAPGAALAPFFSKVGGGPVCTPPCLVPVLLLYLLVAVPAAKRTHACCYFLLRLEARRPHRL